LFIQHKNLENKKQSITEVTFCMIKTKNGNINQIDLNFVKYGSKEKMRKKGKIDVGRHKFQRDNFSALKFRVKYVFFLSL